MQSEFVDIQAKQNIQDESETRSSHTQSERPFLRPRGLLDRLSYRRTVTLEIAVAAVDRLDRVTPPRERARAQLCAVARQRDIPQGGHPVVKCDTACGCVAGVLDMRSECDILPVCRRVHTRLQ